MSHKSSEFLAEQFDTTLELSSDPFAAVRAQEPPSLIPMATGHFSMMHLLFFDSFLLMPRQFVHIFTYTFANLMDFASTSCTYLLFGL